MPQNPFPVWPIITFLGKRHCLEPMPWNKVQLIEFINLATSIKIFLEKKIRYLKSQIRQLSTKVRKAWGALRGSSRPFLSESTKPWG